MSFVASVSIAAEHPGLESEIAALDAYLEANRGHRVRVAHAAGILRLDRDLVRRLLDAYVAEGAVARVPAYVCPDCDGFLERVSGEGDLFCDVCEKMHTFRGGEAIGEKVYRPLPFAPSKLREDEILEAPATANSPGKVVIQIIAGDRGGGPRALLQIPREDRKIKESVALGARHDSFEFANSEFAASIDDVIACQLRRPMIVHFVGHGEERHLVLVRDRDPLVETMRLHQDQAEVLFRNFPARVRLVFFNTCHSVGLGRHLVEKGAVDMAIGIEGKIPDDHAVRFAVTFYRQLAEGRPVQAAFDLAGIHTADLEPASRPQLFPAAGVNPAAETFCCPLV